MGALGIAAILQRVVSFNFESRAGRSAYFHEHDYSQRAVKETGDEIGAVRQFNQMLSQIEARDRALIRPKASEQRVRDLQRKSRAAAPPKGLAESGRVERSTLS